jgi:hypothetical protein
MLIIKIKFKNLKYYFDIFPKKKTFKNNLYYILKQSQRILFT